MPVKGMLVWDGYDTMAMHICVFPLVAIRLWVVCWPLSCPMLAQAGTEPRSSSLGRSLGALHCSPEQTKAVHMHLYQRCEILDAVSEWLQLWSVRASMHA
jgi:hypothetical protein